MSHEDKRPVAIEDLLRLKRAERPPAEFWERFDRELRAKQLAALVQKRPWWQAMPRFVPVWRRFRFPLGATAVLAVTFVSLREYSQDSASPVTGEQSSATLWVVVPSGSQVTRDVIVPVSAVETSDGLADANSTLSEFARSTSEAPAVRDAVLGTQVAVAPAGARLDEELPVASRPLDATFAAGSATPSVLGQGLLGGSRVSTRGPSARGTAIEPLAQMIPPGEARRARILSAMSIAASGDTLVRGSEIDSQPVERVARNLSDDRMNDSIRRFNAKGDRFSFKL